MVKSIIYFLVLLSVLAEAAPLDLRSYLPTGKYSDSERGCSVDVSHRDGKIKVSFSVAPNPLHVGESPQDYILGGSSWIELDAQTGIIVGGDSVCWKTQATPATQLNEQQFVYGNSCRDRYTRAEKVQLQASVGNFSGLLFQREVFQLRPVDAGLVYEGSEEMHFGCKLKPAVTSAAQVQDRHNIAMLPVPQAGRQK